MRYQCDFVLAGGDGDRNVAVVLWDAVAMQQEEKPKCRTVTMCCGGSVVLNKNGTSGRGVFVLLQYKECSSLFHEQRIDAAAQFFLATFLETKIKRRTMGFGRGLACLTAGTVNGD